MPKDPHYMSQLWKEIRLKVLKRDKWICCRCKVGVRGKKFNETTPFIDHVIPRHKGGTDELRNLQTLCGRCHTLKTKYVDYGTGKPINDDGLPPDWI